MKNSSRFLNIYNEIDNYMRVLLEEDSRASHIQLIDKLSKKSNLFKNYKNDLKEFAELRNAIVHNTHFCGNKYGEVIAEPHEVVVEMYEELLEKIMKPQTAKDVYRRIDDENVFCGTLESKVIDIINYMHDKEFTCVPILENKKLVGVFSENVLLSLIARKVNIDFNNLIINEIIDLVNINNHNGEYFEFCRVKDTVFDIKDFFTKKRDDRKRLEMIFVTGNGLVNEEIIGIISAWDLI